MTNKNPRCVNCGHLLQRMENAFDMYTGENIWDHKKYEDGDISCFCGCLEAELPGQHEVKKMLGFEPIHRDSEKSKTKKFKVHKIGQDESLGEIRWYSHWRRYVFFPLPDTVFDSSCLKEITDFIDQEMCDWKVKTTRENYNRKNRDTMIKKTEEMKNTLIGPFPLGFNYSAFSIKWEQNDILNKFRVRTANYSHVKNMSTRGYMVDFERDFHPELGIWERDEAVYLRPIQVEDHEMLKFEIRFSENVVFLNDEQVRTVHDMVKDLYDFGHVLVKEVENDRRDKNVKNREVEK